MKKRVVAVMLIAVMTTLLAVGCGEKNSNQKEENSTKTEDTQKELEKITVTEPVRGILKKKDWMLILQQLRVILHLHQLWLEKHKLDYGDRKWFANLYKMDRIYNCFTHVQINIRTHSFWQKILNQLRI